MAHFRGYERFHFLTALLNCPRIRVQTFLKARLLFEKLKQITKTFKFVSTQSLVLSALFTLNTVKSSH